MVSVLYKNKYRIESARLKNWDYSSDGCYFITICTHDRKHYFGKINNGKMILTDIGAIAEQYWCEIPGHFPQVRLDEWVIMPNHVHGIVVIDKSIIPPIGERGTTGDMVATATGSGSVPVPIPVETPNLGVSTTTATTTTTATNWKPGTIGVIINQYKRICTILSRKINAAFAWQPRFHDHIIRNNDELCRIQEYIVNNPANWDNDDLQCPNANLVDSISEHTTREQ